MNDAPMRGRQAYAQGAAAVARALRAAASATRDTRRFETDRLDRRDPQLISTLLPALRFLNSHYFRLEVDGVDNIPDHPVLYVANHNGGIIGPDLAGTMQTLWSTRGVEAPVYAMAHDFAMRQLKPMGRLVQRLGGLRATRFNALTALSTGGQVLVYPGGELDAFRHYRRRNEVVFGQRTGFVRVAQAAGVPIVPIVAQGAHGSALILHEGVRLARLLGLRRLGRHDRFPLALALPWGVAVGPWLPYLPLPCSVRLRVLPEIRVPRAADPTAVRESVRGVMQEALLDLARRAVPDNGAGSERGAVS